MKTTITLIMSAVIAASTLSCTTTYDAYGNPRQSVDPATAVAGVAAAGVLGYALARDKNDDNRHYSHHRNHGYYDRYGRYRRY